MALDLVRDTKEGFVPNDTALVKAHKQSQNALSKTTKAQGTKSFTNLRLEMDAIKEEDNSIFKGLGAHHNRSML